MLLVVLNIPLREVEALNANPSFAVQALRVNMAKSFCPEQLETMSMNILRESFSSERGIDKISGEIWYDIRVRMYQIGIYLLLRRAPDENESECEREFLLTARTDQNFSMEFYQNGIRIDPSLDENGERLPPKTKRALRI